MDRLLDSIRPLVARWALVLTGSPDAAEDVAQAVLLRVHRGLTDYSAQGRFAAWLYRVTRNVVADRRRTLRRERARMDAFGRDQLIVWLGERDDALELLAAADELRRFMTELSPRQRAVVDLIELQGFSTDEAAEMLGISPATTRVHLHRAKSALSGVVDAGRERRSHG